MAYRTLNKFVEPGPARGRPHTAVRGITRGLDHRALEAALRAWPAPPAPPFRRPGGGYNY